MFKIKAILKSAWSAVSHYFTALNILRIVPSGVLGWGATMISEVQTLSPSALFFVGLAGFALTIWVINGITWWYERRTVKKAPIFTEPSDSELKYVSGKVFRNETVILDGHRYAGCVFENVTLCHNGGPFAWSGSKFIGTTWVHSDLPELNRHKMLHKALGHFKDIVIFGKDRVSS